MYWSVIGLKLFEKIPQDKQRLILNAAYACFGRSGYRKASIADIAEAAGVSKASLFQYFGTKKELYLFLYRHAIDEIVSRPPEGSDDFFACIRAVSAIKMEVFAKHPGMFDFLSSTIEEAAPEVAEDLKALAAKSVEQGISVVFAKVDWTRFKTEIDRAAAVNAITWISEGYLRSALGKKDADTMCGELAAYMELLKKAFYQEKYLT